MQKWFLALKWLRPQLFDVKPVFITKILKTRKIEIQLEQNRLDVQKF